MAMLQSVSMASRYGFGSLVLPSITSGLLNLGFCCRKTNVSISSGQCRAVAYAGVGGAAGQALLLRTSVQRGAAAAQESSGATTTTSTASAGGSELFRGWRECSMFSVLSYIEDLTLGGEGEKLEAIASGVIAAGLVLFLALAAPFGASAADVAEMRPYFGTAASASSYGGYGGNSNKQTTAEYTFQVPQGWKEKTITKIEKGTNGTDAEFDNPKHKEEKVYVTYLPNFRQLAPIERVLENLALSDPGLQDIIAFADGNIKSSDRKDPSGQQYYDYEIDSPVANVLVSVTCAKNKLYAHFVKAGPSDWARDQTLLRQMHESFQTVGSAPLGD